MSLQPSMRSNAVLGVLAVAAFVVVLAVSNRDRLLAFAEAMRGGESATAENARRSLRRDSAETAGEAQVGSHLAQSRASTSDDSHAPGTAPGAPNEPKAPRAPGAPGVPGVPDAGGAIAQAARQREPSAEQLQTIARLSETVMPREETTAEEAEDRGNAIRQLGALPGSQAAQALMHAIRNDVDPRNRILAVESLRRAGANGDAGWAIRDALREAASSSDEVVAAQARAAYDDLVAKLGTQR